MRPPPAAAGIGVIVWLATGLFAALPAGATPDQVPPTAASALAGAGPADDPVPVHVGVFDPNTPAARQLAGDVARRVAAMARKHPRLQVSVAPLETWLSEPHFRHESALLACMDPWLSRRAVLGCVQSLPFPPMPPPMPAQTRFVVSGTLESLDGALVVKIMLQPVVKGWAGPSVVTRQVTITRRMRRPTREKALASAIAQVLDAAAADGLPPPRSGRSP